jgi:hypothetical protein
MNPNDPDLTLGVEFFMKPFELAAETVKAGRPIFEDREMVRIAFPGDNKREHVAPAHEMHYHSGQRRQMTYAERFADSYRRFKEENADQVIGTPIAQLPFLTEARRAEFKAAGIKTAEQLAGLPDVTIKKMGMGTREFVTQAQAFLKAAEGTSQVAAMQAQIDELKALLAAKAAPQSASDPFAGMERDDLFNMATDAGLEPRANASLDSLKALLLDAAKKKEAA